MQEALVVPGHEPSTILDALVAIVAGAPTLAAAGAFPWRPLEETLLDASATLARSSDLFWIAMRGLPGETMLCAWRLRPHSMIAGAAYKRPMIAIPGCEVHHARFHP